MELSKPGAWRAPSSLKPGLLMPSLKLIKKTVHSRRQQHYWLSSIMNNHHPSNYWRSTIAGITNCSQTIIESVSLSGSLHSTYAFINPLILLYDGNSKNLYSSIFWCYKLPGLSFSCVCIYIYYFSHICSMKLSNTLTWTGSVISTSINQQILKMLQSTVLKFSNLNSINGAP